MRCGVGLGFHCSHEQHPPSVLLSHAKRAADAGFRHGMCSDHFRPWSERQGHSGFAWAWLGAALESTPLSFGTVCAPGQRYHPALIAQAASTLAEMYGERFWMAVGSGEALNEAITAQPWPAKSERNARLEESADAMRRLWAGETVTVAGRIAMKETRLYSAAPQPPLLLAAALSPETARWAGAWADGLITVAGPRDAMRRVIDGFKQGGGAGKPLFLQVAVSYAPSDTEAVQAAHDQWRHCVLDSDTLANLSTPREFDEACARANAVDVVKRIRTSADICRHLDWLHEDASLGFDRIYLHNVARDHQNAFLEACGLRLIPEFVRAHDIGWHRPASF
jgi:coenzyme F420-dependent glucose-6-phosphate dehydrogenase